MMTSSQNDAYPFSRLHIKTPQNTVFDPICPFWRGVKFRPNHSKIWHRGGFQHSNVHLKSSVLLTRVVIIPNIVLSCKLKPT